VAIGLPATFIFLKLFVRRPSHDTPQIKCLVHPTSSTSMNVAEVMSKYAVPVVIRSALTFVAFVLVIVVTLLMVPVSGLTLTMAPYVFYFGYILFQV